MTQEARSAASSRKKPAPTAARTPGHAFTGTGPAFQQYQSAVQLLQQGKFEKALAAFEKLLPTAPPELMERCQMYITTCQRQVAKPALSFASPEEHYDYAVSQLNTGYYEEAREQFQPSSPGTPAPTTLFTASPCSIPSPAAPRTASPTSPAPSSSTPETVSRPASITTSRAWWTTPASLNCCILKLREPDHTSVSFRRIRARFQPSPSNRSCLIPPVRSSVGLLRLPARPCA